MPVETTRYDLYGPIHKGLRLMLSQLLVRLGQADYADAEVRRLVLVDLRRQLVLSALHLEDEGRFIHPELAGRDAAAVAMLEADHEEHRRTLTELVRLADELEAAPPAAAVAVGRRLYLVFSRFVAEDFAHMHEEEMLIQPLLHAHFTDAELATMEQSIIASLPQSDLLAFLLAMLPAMTADERRALLAGVRAGAPQEVFAWMIDCAARPSLDRVAWEKLAADLALAA